MKKKGVECKISYNRITTDREEMFWNESQEKRVSKTKNSRQKKDTQNVQVVFWNGREINGLDEEDWETLSRNET